MPRKGYADVLEKDPTKKVSEEERIGRTKQKLGPDERKALLTQLEQAEIELKGRKDLSDRPDFSDVQAQINKLKMILGHDEEVGPKSATEKDRLWARAKDLQEKFKKEMPTYDEMWPKQGSVMAQRGLRHNIKFQADNKSELLEYREVMTKLNPDDPDAASLELIRPGTPGV